MAEQPDPIENFAISRQPPKFAWRERAQDDQGERLREVVGIESAMTPDELAGLFLVREGGHPEPMGAPKSITVGPAALSRFRRLGRLSSRDAQRKAIVAYAGRFSRLGLPKMVLLTRGPVGELVDAEPEILWRTESRALADLDEVWRAAQALKESGRPYWRQELQPNCVLVPDDANLDPLRVPLFAGIPAIPSVGHEPEYSDEGKTVIAVRKVDWSDHQRFANAVQRSCAEWLEGRLFRSISVEVTPGRGPKYTPVGGLSALLLAAALELSGNKRSVRCKYEDCGERFYPARPSRALFCSKNHSHLWHYHHPAQRRLSAPASPASQALPHALSSRSGAESTQ